MESQREYVQPKDPAQFNVSGIKHDYQEPLTEPVKYREISNAGVLPRKPSNAQNLTNHLKVSRNLQAFKNRDICYNLWAEFEDEENEPILGDQDENIGNSTKVTATPSVHNKTEGGKGVCDVNLDKD